MEILKERLEIFIKTLSSQQKNYLVLGVASKNLGSRYSRETCVSLGR